MTWSWNMYSMIDFFLIYPNSWHSPAYTSVLLCTLPAWWLIHVHERLIPRLHLAPARGFDPRGESDSPFSPNVNANHQPREAGLTRLFCSSKKVGFNPRAGSDTAIFCSVNWKPSLPRRLIANFRWRSRASFELRFSMHTVPYTRFSTEDCG